MFGTFFPQRWFPCYGIFTSSQRAGSPCFDWRRAWKSFSSSSESCRSLRLCLGESEGCWFFLLSRRSFSGHHRIQYLKHVTSGNWKMFKHVKTGSFLNITSQIKSLKYACNSCCSQKCSGDIDLFTWSVLVSRTKRAWVWRLWPRRLYKVESDILSIANMVVQYKQFLYTLVYTYIYIYIHIYIY